MKFQRLPLWLIAMYFVSVIVILSVFMVGLQKDDESLQNAAKIGLIIYFVFSSITSVLFCYFRPKK